MAKDPYRYFRIEAQELLEGLGKGLLQLEKGANEDLLRSLLRQAHTFKGASRVVKRGDIGDLAHQIEDLLSPHREGGGPVDSHTIDGALQLLDRIRQLVAALGAEDKHAASGKPSEEAAEYDDQTIRVAIHDLDELLEGAFEAHAAASALRREAEHLGRLQMRARDLVADLDPREKWAAKPLAEVRQVVAEIGALQRNVLGRIEQVLGELAETRVAASEIRLVPTESLTIDLERAVRDAARTLGKEVEIRCTGSQTQLDAHVLAGLRKALVHIVRNSVAHGIEAPPRRKAAGKPPAGSIDISIDRRGHRVAIRCQDDGGGLDVESVRTAAIERGLVSPEEARSMDENALGRLLLSGGVSTSRTVTGVSGRGVGLDAVRETVEALRGEISLQSTQGKGTTVEILVPLSLSAMPALAVQVDGTAVLVPLDSVRRTLRISHDDISRDAQGERLVVDGKVIPLLPLGRALKRPRREVWAKQSAVVIEAEGRLAAVAVDRVGAARSVVVRNIPVHTACDPIVPGAALDDEGVPQLVVAPPALIRAAQVARPVAEEPSAQAAAPLLVIDDSLTTRMLEQSILESAGYEVDLAVSGEDALNKARTRRYGLFIVDIEMPGMDGFEFIEAARRDPRLKDTPSILVTSRTDVQDKRRGKEVGARAYIVKSEFDQAELLDSVRRLVG